MNYSKKQIRGYGVSELENWLKERSEPKYRAKQIFTWVQKGISDFDEMSNVSKKLREELKLHFMLDNMSILECVVSDDGTCKYLLELTDGEMVECVLLKYKYGYTLCVSTQVGCRMGCTFCASALNGCVRQLQTAEIIGQILIIQTHKQIRIGHIVLMGSGEPLDNYDEVLKFLYIIHDERGLNIGWRNITLSTCGMVPEILKLADEQLPITLAVSLHSSDDEERSAIMPINRKYNVDKLLEACTKYIEKTGRRITFEYALIRSKNDDVSQARALAGKLRGMLCHVNLIPINPVKERGYKASSDSRIKAFQKEMQRAGIDTTIRRELGSDINAACGQLRNKRNKKKIQISLSTKQ